MNSINNKINNVNKTYHFINNNNYKKDIMLKKIIQQNRKLNINLYSIIVKVAQESKIAILTEKK